MKFVFLKNEYFWVGLLIALGLLTRLFFLGNPAEVVFDEVHFGKFVSAYFTGEYYFDIHPPLGKLLIALGALLGGYGSYVAQNGVFPFETIASSYDGMPYVWFRLMPALAGALLPWAVYLFVKSLGAKSQLALLVGFSLVLDNALLTQAHFALLDSFLLLFGFLGLAAFFFARENNYAFFRLTLAGALLALSFSIKWTGLAFWGLAGLVFAYDFVRLLLASRAKKEELDSLLKGLVAFFLVPAGLYFSVFAIHFQLLPQCPGLGGNGCAYMDQGFQELPLWSKFLQLNEKMYFYNTTLTAEHAYGSPAWTWPIMQRSVYYWYGQPEQAGAGAQPGQAGRVYLLGNPVLWYLALFGLVVYLFWWRRLKLVPELRWVLLVGYLANWLPFFSVNRVLFLYHYLAAFVFSVVMFWLAAEVVLRRLTAKNQAVAVWGLLLVLALGFAFFAPLSYGLTLSDKAFNLRMLFPSWI